MKLDYAGSPNRLEIACQTFLTWKVMVTVFGTITREFMERETTIHSAVYYKQLLVRFGVVFLHNNFQSNTAR